LAKKDEEEGKVTEAATAFMTETDFEDEGIQSTEADFYKGVKGTTHRLWIPVLAVIMVFTHYVEEGAVGSVLSDGEYKRNEKGIWKNVKPGPIDKFLGEEAQPRFGLNLVQYATKKDGTVGKPFSYVIKCATWRKAHFTQVRTAHTAFKKMGGLSMIDLMVNCESAEYQRLTFQGVPECLIRTLDEAAANSDKSDREAGSLIKEVMEECADPGWDVRKMLGKKLTLAELKRRMKGKRDSAEEAPKGKAAETLADEDLDDVIAGLG